LGVFAGLLTFASASAGFFRFNPYTPIEDALPYYALFALILIVGLGLFALFLQTLFIKDQTKEDQTKEDQTKEDQTKEDQTKEDQKLWKKILSIKCIKCMILFLLAIILATTLFSVKKQINDIKSKLNTEQTDNSQNDDNDKEIILDYNE